MSILVNDSSDETKPEFVDSKDIICPKCGETAKLDITEYKIFI